MATQPTISAIQPPISAIQPPNLALQTPNLVNQPVTPVPTAQAEACQEPQGKIIGTSSGLYYPEITDTSWTPTEEFKNFLEKHFHRKLTFDQVCDILEEQAVPSVDALVALVFDPSMLQHVAASNKKFIQERDRELAGIHRAMLNATGSLCTSHDQLKQGVTLESQDLKLILQQTLCLLGSANTQLSTIRRKKILASINKSKIDLATQPLPNAKKWLFGDDFPICEVPFCEDGFFSRFFVAPKRDRSMRPIIDRSPLNRFVDTPHFQMENLASVKSLLRQGHFMTKIDLKDAYFSVAIPPQSQKFLRFLWQNKAFQFCFLPLGLNIAPSLFTRLMKPVAGFLRKRDVRLLQYVDDMLIIGSTPREVNDFTQMAVNLLKAFGFIINLDKSVLTPTQVITFLGFTINSITMRFTLPSEKVQKLLTLCRQIHSNSKVLLRTLAQLLGLLESYRQAVWQAPLHFRYLRALLIRGLNQMNHNYEAPVSLCSQSLGEINWWLQNLETVNGSRL